jgi:hypothetical protein
MNRLVRLYPRAWRDRYLAELEDLLLDRPPTLADRLDIVRGALDAWIHPQLAGRPRQEAGTGAGLRLLGAGASALGGALWIAGGLAAHGTQVNQALGYKESTAALILLIGGALVTAAAGIALVRSASDASRNARVVTGVMLGGALLIVLPWPILIVGFFGYTFATVAFGFVLAKAGNRTSGALLSIGALILTSFNFEDERALLTIPFGLAWIALGSLALRRASAATTA